jgi:hypothetical protein
MRRVAIFATVAICAIVAASATIWPGQSSVRAQSSDDIPDTAHIIYKGNYTGKVETGGPRPRTQTVTGAITFDVTYDHAKLRGHWTATGPLSPSTFFGTRTGNKCSLDDGSSGSGTTQDITCTATVFSGQIVNSGTGSQTTTLTFTALMDDTAQREADASASAESSRQAASASAESSRSAESARQDALLKSLPPVKPQSPAKKR